MVIHNDFIASNNLVRVAMYLKVFRFLISLHFELETKIKLLKIFNFKFSSKSKRKYKQCTVNWKILLMKDLHCPVLEVFKCYY